MPRDEFWLSQAPGGTYYHPIRGISSVGYGFTSVQFEERPQLLDKRLSHVNFVDCVLGRCHQERVRRTGVGIVEGRGMLWDPISFDHV